MNKMKKYFFLIVSLTFVTYGCEDILHEEEFRYAEINTKDDLESLTNGVHGTLNWAGNILYLFDDLMYPNYSYYIVQQNMPATNVFGSEAAKWSLIYATIASANNILTQYEKGRLTNPEYKGLIGENYFYRAYCYFCLTRVFGEIPLVKDKNVSYTIEKSPVKSIYESIEKDLLTAIALLTTESRLQYITPHSGTAKALLAEVYISWAGFPVKDESKYPLAAAYAGDVIDNADVYGYKLLPDYADVWKSENMFHDEIIFNFAHVYIGNTMAYDDSDTYPYSVFGKVQIDSENTLYHLAGASSILYNAFPKDYRRDITFFNQIYVHQRYNQRKLNAGHHYIDSANVRFVVGYRKFYYNTNVEQFQSIGNKKKIILRFPHALLTYAEAVARSGEVTDNAYHCINMIRRRANKVNLDSESVYDLTKGLSASAFIDSVLAERNWELCGENSDRWFVLLRTEKLASAFQDNINKGVYSGTVPESFYSKKPGVDVNLNPGIE